MKTTLFRGASAATLGAVLAIGVAGAAEAATVTGAVTNTDGTVALEGAIVRIDALNRTARTDADGMYRFVNLPAGDYEVTVSYIGAAAASATVTLDDEADVATADFSLNGVDREVIVVTGQRGKLFASLNQQRAADNLVSVLGADAIGDFPDQNVAESARRISGLSVFNDQGEGRFVIIRGLAPTLNAVTINGLRTTSPEFDSRQVPLDVIDSELLDGIIVSKSLTPDMDGAAIGGSLEVKSLNAFERDGLYVKGVAEALYTDLADEFGSKFAVTASQQFMDGRLGLAGSISYRDRPVASDNVEVDGPDWDEDSGFLFPEELEQRDYDITRERLSFAFNVDARPNDNTDLFFRTLYSDFEDQEYRSRVETKLTDGEFSSALSAGTTSVFVGTPDDELEIDRDIKDRLETQVIFSAVAGGQSRFDAWTIDYQFGYAYADEEEPDRLDTDYRAQFDDGTAIGVNTINPLRPSLVFLPGSAGILDTDNYEFDGAEFLNGVTTDREYSAKLDVQRDVVFGENPGFVKAGGLVRLREKRGNVDAVVYDGFDGADLALTDVARTIDYGLGQLGPVPNPFAVRDFFFANQDSFEVAAFDTAIATNIEDYNAEEDVYAGYAMGQVDIDALRLTGGVRVEYTDIDAEASQVFLVDDGGDTSVFPDTILLAEDDGDVALFGVGQASDSYVDVLPSINAKFDASERVVLRAAYYRSIARPNIGQFVPVAEVEVNDEDEREAAFGNPDLEHQVADNFDITAEYYIGDSGIVSLGFFFKDIDDYIAEQVFNDVTVNGLAYDQIVSAVNLTEATALGLEFNYQQPLDMLPAPFDGLIVGLNYTFVDGSANLQGGREIPLPLLSESIANVVLGYEKGPFDLKASLTYRDEYLDVIDAGGIGSDRFIEDHLQFDVSAKVDVTDSVRVFAEFQNITDEPYVAYVPGFGTRLNAQFEEYSYSANFGVRVTY